MTWNVLNAATSVIFSLEFDLVFFYVVLSDVLMATIMLSFDRTMFLRNLFFAMCISLVSHQSIHPNGCFMICA